jgi:serine/threonine protein kinase
MGTGKHANVVYIIDFGLSKEYRSPNTRAHIPYSCGHGFTGIAAFASVNSHFGVELGRRDDLESLAYALIYFLWGSLPWGNLRKSKDILALKQEITSHAKFHKLPVEFHTFLQDCQSLAFHSKPNYDRYYDLFNDLLLQHGFDSSASFDWDVAGG